ncbi:PAAR domain-containing protein [Burkholderia glumae]
MIDLIRLGDSTDHDGKVISASKTMRFDGRWVARKRPVQKLPRGAVYFLGKLLTLGIRTTEVQGWKRQSLTTNCGY